MATEVFNRIGEGESFSENPNFFKRQKRDYGNDEEPSMKVESSSKPITEAKKEFFEHLENDSLTIDACDKLNHDWENKQNK